MGHDINLASDINLYVRESAYSCTQLLQPEVRHLVHEIIDCVENNRPVFLVANGGTAGIFSNMYADLMIHPFVSEDKSSKGSDKNLVIHNLCDMSAFTALTNDLGYENAFAFFMSKMNPENGLLIAASGSGTSKNVLKAMEVAKEFNATTCMITKNKENAQLADIPIVFDGSSDFPGQTGKNNFNFHYEDLICKLGHVLSGALKQYINGNEKQYSNKRSL
jgi:D-sedoheptulose 7-phosphate isomerase